MKLRLIFFGLLCSAVSGLLFWRNANRYPTKSMLWLITKSLTELGLVMLTALRLPVMLVSWCCLWATKPIETPWIKVTVGVIAGTILGFLSMFALEVLIFLSVFSIDEITGEESGFLMNLKKAKQESQAA